MTSSSTSGVSVITVNLRLNYDADAAMTEISAKVSSVINQLPSGTQQPTMAVSVGQTTDAMYLGFRSQVLASNQITDYLTRVVQPKLQAVKGVQTAEILGGKTFALRAWLKPDKLASYGLTAGDVWTALATNNVISGIGTTEGQMTQTVLTAQTDLHSPQQFADMVVKQIGTAVIDMRYENPLYMAEDAGAADLIAGGRLQLGISRGSPEQVIDGWRYFGHVPQDGQTDADMARHYAEVFLDVLKGQGFAQPNPRPMFPNPPGLLRLEPHSEGLRDRIWWGAATNATAQWAARLGMNLQSSTLKFDEGGKPFHIQQAEQIRAYREAWKEAGHEREPRVSVSRSIFALVNDLDRAYFGGDESQDHFGYIEADTRAVFGRSYAAEPDVLIEELKKDEAIAEADTLLLTVPNQLGVAYNAHVIEAILSHVAPVLGWR